MTKDANECIRILRGASVSANDIVFIDPCSGLIAEDLRGILPDGVLVVFCLDPQSSILHVCLPSGEK